MRPLYLVVTVLQNKNESVFTTRKNNEFSPGYYSYVIALAGNENLKSVLNHIGGLQSANLRDTKKAAAELASKLNENHKANGEYLYD